MFNLKGVVPSTIMMCKQTGPRISRMLLKVLIDKPY